MFSNIVSTIAIFLSACGLIFNLFLYLERKRGKQLSMNVHLKAASVSSQRIDSGSNSLFVSAIIENNSTENVIISKLAIQSSEHTIEAEYSKRLVSTCNNGGNKYPLYTNKMPINISAKTGIPVLIEFRFHNYINWFFCHSSQLKISTNKGLLSINLNLENSRMNFDDFLSYESIL